MTSGETENPFALSIGDLMAALLLIFILLVGATLLLVKEDEQRTVELISEYEALQDSLYEDLRTEFKDDLPRWSAVIERKTLSIRFTEPEVLFEKGEATVRPRFKRILDNFFLDTFVSCGGRNIGPPFERFVSRDIRRRSGVKKRPKKRPISTTCGSPKTGREPFSGTCWARWDVTP